MESNISKNIGKRIKLLRIEKDLKQSELAKILNVTHSNVSKYERGEIEINFETLVTLCEYFEVSLDYLFGFTDLKKKEDNNIDDAYIIVSKEAFEKGFSAEQIKTAIEFYEKVMKDIQNKKK